VNWTMIMSSRGWQALHGLAGQPAALSIGIPHGPAVRAASGNSGSRQGGRGGPTDRLLAPGFAPRTDRFGVTPYSRDPQDRAELRGLPGWKPRPEACACLRYKRSKAIFLRSLWSLTCGNVKLREFEP
jgi:hypothetical protein